MFELFNVLYRGLLNDFRKFDRVGVAANALIDPLGLERFSTGTLGDIALLYRRSPWSGFSI